MPKLYGYIWVFEKNQVSKIDAIQQFTTVDAPSFAELFSHSDLIFRMLRFFVTKVCGYKPTGITREEYEARVAEQDKYRLAPDDITADIACNGPCLVITSLYAALNIINTRQRKLDTLSLFLMSHLSCTMVHRMMKLNQSLGIDLDYKKIAISSTFISLTMAFCINALEYEYGDKYITKTQHTKVKWMDYRGSDCDVWNKKQAKKWLKQRLNSSDVLKNVKYSLNLLELTIYSNNTHEMIVKLNVSNIDNESIHTLCSQLKAKRLYCRQIARKKHNVTVIILKFCKISGSENSCNFPLIRYVSGLKIDAPAAWYSGIIIGLSCTVASILKLGDGIVFNLMVKDASRSRAYDDGVLAHCAGAMLASTMVVKVYQSIKAEQSLDSPKSLQQYLEEREDRER